ncbi:hypothetical protein ACHAXH_005572, partial [Discostella pseudostelligera]
MSKVFTAYAQRISVDMKSLRFFFDGERIKDTDTPDLLELEDGGQIDCVFQQVGGGDNDDGGYNKENVKPTMKTNKHRRVSNQQSQKSKKHRRNESNVSDSMNENETIQMNMSTKKQKEKLPVSNSSGPIILAHNILEIMYRVVRGSRDNVFPYVRQPTSGHRVIILAQYCVAKESDHRIGNTEREILKGIR